MDIKWKYRIRAGVKAAFYTAGWLAGLDIVIMMINAVGWSAGLLLIGVGALTWWLDDKLARWMERRWLRK